MVELIGGTGTTLEIRPGNCGLQARVGHDRLDDAIQASVAGRQISFKGREPAGDITQGGIVGAVLIGETAAIAVERKAEVVEAIEHRIDQSQAIEFATAAIALNRVKATFNRIVVVAMQGGEQGLTFGMGWITHPGVEGHHISDIQHRLLKPPDRP